MVGLAPRVRAQVGDPGVLGHQSHERGGLVGIGRVQHDARVHRAERGEILERHLRRPVLADRDAGVRADQVDVRAADRGHADEVVGPREERGERRGERPEAADLEADRRGDQLLLGDEHLEVAVGMGLGEHLREGRVRHLAVERDDVGALGAERRQRLAVGHARGDLVVRPPARPLHVVTRVEVARRVVAVGLRHLDAQVALAAQLGDRLGRIRQRLAVLAEEILHLARALALDRPSDDHGRPIRGARRLGQRVVDRGRRRARRSRSRATRRPRARSA